jgi:hypothetical protein
MTEFLTNSLNVISRFDWSTIAGLIGALTGIISLVKVSKLKSLDLRMERGREINTIQVKMDSLNDLCKEANESRVRRAAAQGISNSSVMEKWKIDHKEHEENIEALSKQFLALKDKRFSNKNLEKNILELHHIKEQVCSLIDNLGASIAEDDVARERLFRMKFGNQNSAAAQ